MFNYNNIQGEGGACLQFQFSLSRVLAFSFVFRVSFRFGRLLRACDACFTYV